MQATSVPPFCAAASRSDGGADSSGQFPAATAAAAAVAAAIVAAAVAAGRNKLVNGSVLLTFQWYVGGGRAWCRRRCAFAFAFTVAAAAG